MFQNTSQQARDEVSFKTANYFLQKDEGLVAAAGTILFSRWDEQLITKAPRYDDIVNELKDVS
jgi:hypothetical protein